MTTATADVRATLLDHDRRFFDALVAGDAAALGDLLADDFVLVAVGDGAVAGKADLLGLVASGDLSFPEVESFPDEAVVRLFGEVGIVVGRTAMNFTGPDGEAFAAGSRYTHVFAPCSNGSWRLVSAQGTEIKPGA
ncbi:YybH family protein [Sphaerisporangium fuscum]|uniref:YybH family protein n=1 Tax=Sphaerisporangium fuscum TaxID=2835868 RepID=UPI001BDD3903|nr:nuclear transport factor 2 family protein [Sphaerisporangium fuscum]